MHFKNIFNTIKEYHKELGYDTEFMTDKEKLQMIRDSCLALHQEVAELTDSFPWKPWRALDKQTYDKENAKEEMIDCIFFLVGICEAAEITVIELEKMFLYKLDKNHARISVGYNNAPEKRR